MATIKSRLSALLLGLLSVSVLADSNSDAMLASLKTRYPATRFDSIRASNLPGIWEVVMGKNVGYVDGTGRYFLFGHLWDMEKQMDLTAMRQPVASAGAVSSTANVSFASLRLEDAITLKKGSGKRVVAVFSDPLCGYCQQLEQSLERLEDTTVYIFPITYQPGAREVAEQIWCSTDRREAWRAQMAGRQFASPAKACGLEGLDRNMQLAARMGINATPYLYSVDGRLFPGAMDYPRLVAWLDQAGGGNVVTETRR